MLRRQFLHSFTVPVALSALVSACAVDGPSPASVRRRTNVDLLAPMSAGRRARVETWNEQFADQAAAGLDPVDTGKNLEDHLRATESVLASGERSAVLWLPHELLPGLVIRQALRPVGSLAKRDAYNLKLFMPCALQPGYGVDQKLYCLPEQVDAGQLYFNREHLRDASVDFRRAGLDFERPANTWEGFRRVGLDLLTRQRGATVPFHAGHEGLPLELWGWLNGGGWIADSGRRATFDRAENVQALEWLAGFAQELGGANRLESMTFPPVATAGDRTDQPERHPFLAGRVSLCFESTRFVSTLAAARPDFPIGYVEAPRRWANTPLLTWSRSSGYALLQGAPDVAWTFMQHLISEDACRAAARAEAATAPAAAPEGAGPPAAPVRGRQLWFPPYSGQLAIDKSLAKLYRTGAKLLDEAHDHGLEQLRHARFRDPTPAPQHVWPVLQQVRRQALAGGKPKEWLSQAQERAQQALDQAWSLYEKRA